MRSGVGGGGRRGALCLPLHRGLLSDRNMDASSAVRLRLGHIQ